MNRGGCLMRTIIGGMVTKERYARESVCSHAIVRLALRKKGEVGLVNRGKDRKPCRGGLIDLSYS